MFDFFAAVEASGSGGTATNVLCGGADVLRVVRFAFRILDIGFFIIPILVVLLTTISFGKNVIAKNADDMNKEIPVVIRRIIYCVVIFLLPLFVEAIVKLLGNINILDFKYYSTCYSIAKSDDDLSKFEVIYPEIEGDVTTDTNTNKSYVPASDDDDDSDSVGSGDSANNVDDAKDEQNDLRNSSSGSSSTYSSIGTGDSANNADDAKDEQNDLRKKSSDSNSTYSSVGDGDSANNVDDAKNEQNDLRKKSSSSGK